MRRILLASFAAGLLLVPASLTAQVARAAGPGPAGRGPEPIARILAQRAELGLTAAQVSQLEQIQARAKAQNQPLLEQLKAARPAGAPALRRGAGPAGAGQRVQLQRRLHALQAGVAKLPPEQRAAVRDTARTRLQAQQQRQRARLQQLTPEQRAQMQTRMQEQRGQMRTHMEQVRPIMQQLRENAQATCKDVEAVLTSEQLTRLRGLRCGGGPPAGRAAPRRGPGR